MLGRAGWSATLAIGLLAGGAVGNFVDRLVLGRVIDWIDVRAPVVFNLADIALALGTALAMAALYQVLRSPVRATAEEGGSGVALPTAGSPT